MLLFGIIGGVIGAATLLPLGLWVYCRINHSRRRQLSSAALTPHPIVQNRTVARSISEERMQKRPLVQDSFKNSTLGTPLTYFEATLEHSRDGFSGAETITRSSQGQLGESCTLRNNIATSYPKLLDSDFGRGLWSSNFTNLPTPPPPYAHYAQVTETTCV